MDPSSLIDLQKICRICLKSDLLVSIFSLGFVVAPIDMIEKLNIFKYNPEESYPTSLCQSCIYRLIDAYNLQQLSEASEARLRNYLNSTFIKLCPILQDDDINIDDHDQDTRLSSVHSEIEKNSGIYEIYDIFDTSATKHDNDVLNDVEIDVSSLTRSENDDTIQDILAMKTDMVLGEDHMSDDVVDIIQQASSDVKQITGSYDEIPVKEQIKCNICGKGFNYERLLEIHIRTHTGEKPFKCKICSRQFAQSNNLNLHMRIHSGERRYQCEICSKLFVTSSNLTAHQRVHSDIRNFPCSQCTRSFRTQRELTNHEPIHKKEKEIICELCDKAFLKLSYHNVHMRTVHKGIKNHKCGDCGKEFANKSNLICHVRVHTGEKPYECKICPAKFNQSSALVRHGKQHDQQLKDPTFQATKVADIDPTNVQSALVSDIHTTNDVEILDFAETNELEIRLNENEFSKECVLDFSKQHTSYQLRS